MNQGDLGAAASTDAAHIAEWIESSFHGDVVGLERLARWRPSWFVDVDCGEEVVPLYVRGERGSDFPSPFPLEHELNVHQMLAAHNVKVPRAYGIVEGPIRALVLERLAGQQGLAHAADDETRRRLLLDCIEQIVQLQRIDLSELRKWGMEIPENPDAVVESTVFRAVESAYLTQDEPRDPTIEFLRRWLRRNRPRDSRAATFVTWDSAQFLHHEGILTGLIDFELAHVGHPYMDLAALRTRDSMEPFGDLAPAFARYEQLTGEPIDFDIVRYFEISQLTVTMMLQSPVLNDPDPASDYVTHLTWYVDSARYAMDIMSELTGVEVATLEPPEPVPTRHSAAHRHLVRSLRSSSQSETAANLVRYGISVEPRPNEGGSVSQSSYDGWQARCDYRLARHLQRVDEIEATLSAEEISEVRSITGGAPSTVRDADAELVTFMESAPPEADEALQTFFSRRAQRLHMTLGPRDSLIVRHPPLQRLRTGP